MTITRTPLIDAATTHLASCSLMKEDNFQEVVRTLRLWKHYLDQYESMQSSEAKARALGSDAHIVISLFQEDMGRVKTAQDRNVLIVRDNHKRIQALACFHLMSDGEEKKTLKIKELLSAPWNLRWPKKIYDYPLFGAGVLMIKILTVVAQTQAATSLSLSSTPTASDFYKKIGMTHLGLNRFSIALVSAEVAKIDACVHKIFSEESAKKILTLEDA
jgi:hypothetical protein